MRFIQLLPLAGVAVAQVDVVSGVFKKISDDVAALDSAVKSFSTDVGPVQSAQNSLLADIKSGTTTIEGSASLDITGATQIAQSVTGLQSATQALIESLVNAKPKLVAAGYGGTAYRGLVEQKSAAQALSDATTKKTPTALQSVAQQLSSGIISAVQQGIDSFQDQANTPDNSGGSAAPPAPVSSAPSTPAAPPKSSAPAVTGPATPPACGPTPTTAKTTYATAKPSTTKPGPPSQFTGAAIANQPLVGLALAAAGVIAAF